jgi:hypothetical protein
MSFPLVERHGMSTYRRIEVRLRICRRVRNRAKRDLDLSCLSFRMEQLGRYWTEFYEILNKVRHKSFNTTFVKHT